MPDASRALSTIYGDSYKVTVCMVQKMFCNYIVQDAIGNKRLCGSPGLCTADPRKLRFVEASVFEMSSTTSRIADVIGKDLCEAGMFVSISTSDLATGVGAMLCDGSLKFVTQLSYNFPLVGYLVNANETKKLVYVPARYDSSRDLVILEPSWLGKSIEYIEIERTREP